MRSGFLFLALFVPTAIRPASPDQSAAVQAVLNRQVADWNRGDIPAFVASYAENCTFIGMTVIEGRSRVEERYRRTYSTPGTMGHLAFNNLKIKKIEKKVVVVTGTYSLERSSALGGNKTGVFSLVFQRQGAVWRIVLDHTS